MHGSQGGTDARVGQTAQQAGGRIRVRASAKRLDQENLQEVFHHNLPRRAIRARFVTNQGGQRGETAFAAHNDQIGQQRNQMRERKAGVIVNVSSSVTLKPLPLLPVYTASKAAVNAYTECLALELAPLGIRVRLVLPGRAPTTSFGQNARTLGADAKDPPEDYKPFIEDVMSRFMATADQELTLPADVVEAVWRAVTDPACPLRLPAGSDAVALAA